MVFYGFDIQERSNVFLLLLLFEPRLITFAKKKNLLRAYVNVKRQHGDDASPLLFCAQNLRHRGAHCRQRVFDDGDAASTPPVGAVRIFHGKIV